MWLGNCWYNSHWINDRIAGIPSAFSTYTAGWGRPQLLLQLYEVLNQQAFVENSTNNIVYPKQQALFGQSFYKS